MKKHTPLKHGEIELARENGFIHSSHENFGQRVQIKGQHLRGKINWREI